MALPGLPRSPPTDGLLFLLMCGVFVLALRTSPALLRPKPLDALAPAIAPTMALEAPSFQAPLAAPLPAATQATELPRIFVRHSGGDNAFARNWLITCARTASMSGTTRMAAPALREPGKAASRPQPTGRMRSRAN